MRRWLIAAVVAAALLAPGGAKADILVGAELHAPWTMGVRVEWQPWELLMPSLSIGGTPGGMVSALDGGAALAGTLALGLRLTSIPFPIIGLSFNLGFRGFSKKDVSYGGLELGAGWRLSLGPVEGLAEVGVIFTEPVGGPYVALGVMWIFD